MRQWRIKRRLEATYSLELGRSVLESETKEIAAVGRGTSTQLNRDG